MNPNAYSNTSTANGFTFTMDKDWWRKYGDPEKFPVGTQVVVKAGTSTDFRYFAKDVTGTVVRNHMRYLGIVVKFDEGQGVSVDEWNFHPNDLTPVWGPEAN